jgi:hypothetical protein
MIASETQLKTSSKACQEKVATHPAAHRLDGKLFNEKQ